jgi:hypothetical protein
MDHPASSLDVYRRPLDPTIVRFLGPHTRYLQCGILRSPAHYLFLGLPYPVDDPSQWPPELAAVLGARHAHFGLQLYAKFLREAFEQGLSRLDLEMRYWTAYRRFLFEQLITPHIRHHGPSDHWLWTPAFRHAHPSLNFGGTHDLLVVRLLWALERTGRLDILPPDRNPLGTPECPDTGALRACVNPHHYYIQWTRRDRREAARVADLNADRVVLRGMAHIRRVSPDDQAFLDRFDRAVLRSGQRVEQAGPGWDTFDGDQSVAPELPTPPVPPPVPAPVPPPVPEANWVPEPIPWADQDPEDRSI